MAKQTMKSVLAAYLAAIFTLIAILYFLYTQEWNPPLFGLLVIPVFIGIRATAMWIRLTAARAASKLEHRIS